MALGFIEALTSDHAVAWSGGSEPGHEVNPAVIAAPVVMMEEFGPHRFVPALHFPVVVGGH
jgi:hypothetical protein